RVLVAGRGRAGAAEAAGWPCVVEVDDERAALAELARRVHGRPDESLAMVGVTGTNGKTTTCRLIASVLEAAGVPAGLLGTVEHRLGAGETVAAERTTPEAPDLHRFLARMKDNGCGACVMEVSSHAIELKRVHGIRYSVAVFTNLTRDHLDYHKDMESYFLAKAALFDGLQPGAAAALNLDDPYGRRLAGRLASGRPAVRLAGFGSDRSAWIRIVEVRAAVSGTVVRLAEGDVERDLSTPLVGRPNACNVASAVAATRAMGASWDAVAAGIAAVAGIPGRMERVKAPAAAASGAEVTVLVDYAHTDDALRTALQTAREITPGRLLVVFGCGGDRDRTKRPLMGAHAVRLADVVHVTSDNPRSEDPMAIIDAILAGAAGVPSAERRPGVRVLADPDRARAIEAAVCAARPGDTVLIAGKGHETCQIFGDRTVPFDDREVAREALAGRSPGGAR
ncbi:MAG TPA: UDP-N-acetylmuramoyl-L-alanyl-D-glutamate--2,6-diaminopimelate ligase, partial [Candidatus Polarisedimenticolia bacterium]|nr:UDP-N-acetylmuramoyl-L-alanyl-D-glutamate--2,6-diaminopimelate ligase [Candidatus Polarisedimenticolia bacterium]